MGFMAICSLFFALSASARCVSVLCVSWSSLLRRVHLFGRYHFCVAALGTALKMLPPGASTCLQADRGTEPSGFWCWSLGLTWHCAAGGAGRGLLQTMAMCWGTARASCGTAGGFG